MPLGGRFSGEGMAIFLRFFPSASSLEEFELELILCETQLCQKIAASENRTSESRRTEKRLSSSSSVKALCSYTLDCVVGKSQKKTSCVRKSQRQRDARQRVAGPKKASKLILCPLPNLRLFSQKNPVASENRSVRKSQRQRVARQRIAEPKKGLEAHSLSKCCVHCHALHCFVGSPQERNPVASEIAKKKPSCVRKSQRQRVAGPKRP